MVISAVPGEFDKKFDSQNYIRGIPYAAQYVECIQSNPRYSQALDYFYQFNISLVSEFSLNPKNSIVLGKDNFARAGQFIFDKAALVKQGVYENAEAFLEAVLKIYDYRDQIELKLGRPLCINPANNSKEKKYNIDFEYRRLNGTVTIFIYDGYDITYRYINPLSAALYGITFIGEGNPLERLTAVLPATRI